MNQKNAIQVLDNLKKESKEIVPTITISEAMKIVEAYGFRRKIGSGNLGLTKLTPSHENIINVFYRDGQEELTKKEIFRRMARRNMKANINTIHARISELVGAKILVMSRISRIVQTEDGARTLGTNAYTIDYEALNRF